MTGRPAWVESLLERAVAAPPDFFTRHRPDGPATRASAVLMLLTPAVGAGDDTAPGGVVLTERGAGLRSHAGQIAFPGGRVDPTDTGPVDTALREAREEIGLVREEVDVLTTFPHLPIPASNSLVTPVLGWWRTPGHIGVASQVEVRRVLTVPLAELADPANRFVVTHPVGYRGVGFAVDDVFIWGFTAGLLDRLLVLAAVEREWDRGVTRELPEHLSGGRAPWVARRDEGR